MPASVLDRILLGRKASSSRRPAPVLLDQGALAGGQVVRTKAGGALALWRNGAELMASEMRAKGRWDHAPTPLDPGPGCGLPELASCGNRILAAWTRKVGPITEILVRSFGEGAEAEAVPVVRSREAVEQLRLTLDRRGDALLAWVARGRHHAQVHALSRTGRSGRWDESAAALSAPLARAPRLHLGLGARGEAMVVWAQEDPAFSGLLATHYFAKERTWSDHPLAVMEGAIQELAFAMDAQGHALALAVREAEDRQVLEATAFHAGQACWHRAERLAGARSIRLPKVAMADGGAALALWAQGDGKGASRLMAKAFRGGVWEAKPTALDGGTGPIKEHALAMTPGGRAAALFLRCGQADGDHILLRTFQHGAWSPAPLRLNVPHALPHHGLALDRDQETVTALWMIGTAAKSGMVGWCG